MITCYAGVNVNQPLPPKGFVRNFTQNTAKFLWYWGSCTKPSDVASTWVAPCKGIRIPESEKIWLVKSGILGFGIGNTAQGIRNPTNDWNPESKISMTNSGIRNPLRGIQNPKLFWIPLHGTTWGFPSPRLFHETISYKDKLDVEGSNPVRKLGAFELDFSVIDLKKILGL